MHAGLVSLVFLTLTKKPARLSGTGRVIEASGAFAQTINGCWEN